MAEVLNRNGNGWEGRSGRGEEEKARRICAIKEENVEYPAEPECVTRKNGRVEGKRKEE